MKKKIFIIASALYIASFNALAYTLSYSYDDSAMTASVTGYSGGAGDVIIPSKVSRSVNTGKKDDDGDYIYVTKTYAVTSIGYMAFYDCDGLTSITIPDSLTNIGDYAFVDCSGLTSITIPDSVKSIGHYTFRNCSGLTGVSIGNSVTSIGNSAFTDCIGLTSITIPDSVTSIGYWAFERCSGLTSIIIPDSVTTIGDCAFRNCSGLTGVSIGNSVRSIGNYAFEGCSGLTNITIPDSVTTIGDLTFGRCSGLTSITIPDSVKSIDDYAFYGCSSLTNITIPDSVTTIGDGAFRNCSGLTGVSIGNSVRSIVNYAFEGCSSLTNITIPDSVTTIGDRAFSNCSGLTGVSIGNSVTSIGNKAFNDCDGLTSVTIPNSVTSIGDEAFYGCSSLSDAYFMGIPPEVGVGAFDGVTIGARGYYLKEYQSSWLHKIDNGKWNGLIMNEIGPLLYSYNDTTMEATVIGYLGDEEVITIPSEVERRNYNELFDYIKEETYKVTSIGADAFKCSGITSIEIPDSITSIGENAFKDCNGLKEVHIGYDIGAWCGIKFANPHSNPLSYGGYLYSIPYTTSPIKELYIPDSVTSIGDYAFYGYSGLTSVKICNSATSIGIEVFEGCNNIRSVSVCQDICSQRLSDIFPLSYESITNVKILDGVSTVGDWAFAGCKSFSDITIPDSVTSIGECAFAACECLTSVVIGDGVKSIGAEVFSFCEKLKSIRVSSNNSYYKSDYYHSMLLSKDGETLIEGVNGTVFVPKTVTTIGDSAFMGRRNLTHIFFDKKVKKIGNRAFYNCENLKSHIFSLPPSVKTIGDLAFCYCSGLTSISIPDSVTSIGREAFRTCLNLKWVSFWGDAPKMGSNIFTDCHEDLEIEFYQNADGWDDYLDSTVSSSIFGANYSLKEVSVNEEVGPIIMTEMVDGIEWKYFVKAGKAEIYGGNGWTSAISSNTMGSITIPSQLSDCPVISIHNSAFLDCVGLTNITIPNSVTNIGFAAFSGCSGLTSVTIPDSVTSIDDYAFSGCRDLTSVTIPDSVTSIGDGVFYDCSGLTSVTIPDSVTSIGYGAFRDCDLLKSAIFFGDAPRDVGGCPFEGCADDFVIKVKKGTKGWDGDPNSTELPETWNGYPIEYATEDDLYPELDANATAEDVANALAGSVDENLAKNITSVEMYSKYKAWASVVKAPTGEEAAGVEIVMDSPTAWMSFALDQSKLIANEPVEGDVSIASLDTVDSNGAFEFTVNIDKIDVGDGAVEENLKKLFKIEGATSLGNDANFSSENVEIELAEPVNGDVKFKILPKDSPDSFFIRAKLLK